MEHIATALVLDPRRRQLGLLVENSCLILKEELMSNLVVARDDLAESDDLFIFLVIDQIVLVQIDR